MNYRDVKNKVLNKEGVNCHYCNSTGILDEKSKIEAKERVKRATPFSDLLSKDPYFLQVKGLFGNIEEFKNRILESVTECKYCTEKRSIFAEKEKFFDRIENDLLRFQFDVSYFADMEFPAYQKVYYNLKDFMAFYLKIRCEKKEAFLITAYILSENNYNYLQEEYVFIMNLEAQEYFTPIKMGCFLDNMKRFKNQRKKCVFFEEKEEIIPKKEEKNNFKKL